jgi:hypothetical protein
MKLSTLLATLLLCVPAQATPSAFDQGLMVNVPNLGYSRVETLTFCLNVTGVDKYQDLLTDSEFVTFESCMVGNT